MSGAQTHCSHRFIIATASAGATGHRKRVNGRRGVERGQTEKDERGEDKLVSTAGENLAKSSCCGR